MTTHGFLNTTHRTTQLEVGADALGNSSTSNIILARSDQNATTTIESRNITNDTNSSAQFTAKNTNEDETAIMVVAGSNYTVNTRIQDRAEFQSGAGLSGVNWTALAGNQIFYNNGTEVGKISNPGEWTYAKQPAFSANISTNPTNVTGNSTTYTLACNTEIADRNSDYNTGTFTFTAPVTGLYYLTALAQIDGTTSAATLAQMTIATSNRTYFRRWPAENYVNSSGAILQIVCIADMDSADTATATVQVNGEASDVVDITGTNTFFQGWLLG